MARHGPQRFGLYMILVGWLTYPSGKWWSSSMGFGWHPIYIYISIYEMENKIHVPNHQPVIHTNPNHAVRKVCEPPCHACWCFGGNFWLISKQFILGLAYLSDAFSCIYFLFSSCELPSKFLYIFYISVLTNYYHGYRFLLGDIHIYIHIAFEFFVSFSLLEGAPHHFPRTSPASGGCTKPTQPWYIDIHWVLAASKRNDSKWSSGLMGFNRI